jgi:formylglycine-generating enzyme required for sulfatase activity
MSAKLDRNDEVALAFLVAVLFSAAVLVYVILHGMAGKPTERESLHTANPDPGNAGPEPRGQLAAEKALDSEQGAEARCEMAAEAAELDLRVGKVGFVLVRIPPGDFDMGSPRSEQGHEENEAPIRHIRISKPFYLGSYEVTQALYMEVMKTNPSSIRGDSLPVFEITYREALEFCKRLSWRVGLPITLPTEAQWEYACRAGTTTRYCAGDTANDLDKVGWYRENSGLTVHPVGKKQPNAWGLYDMHGNVCELCRDLLPEYNLIQDVDPIGTMKPSIGGSRGGAWMLPSDSCRSASHLISHNMFKGMGIRVAIDCD